MAHLLGAHDRIILKKVEDTEKMQGGIIIPDTGKERSNVFDVVEVGPGKINEFTNTRIPMDVKVGDRVVVPKAVVRQILIDNEEYWVTREVEVEAFIIE